MNTYTPAFKSKMIQRLVGPGAVSQCELAKRTGVSQQTLSAWLAEAAKGAAMKQKRKAARASSGPGRPEDRSADDRFRILMDAGRSNPEELGALLRREGIHEATLEEWRAAALEALAPQPKSPNRSKEAKHLQQLERELRRKDKALAEAAALLMLQKKVQALWAVADDDTEEPSDE